MSRSTMRLQNEVQLMVKMTELEGSAAYCCFAVYTLPASPCMFKALVSIKGYRAVIISKTGVHGTGYGGNYAERRNITDQARCECDRFMGLFSATSVSARYFIGLAANLVEGADAQVLYFSAQCVGFCKCGICES